MADKNPQLIHPVMPQQLICDVPLCDVMRYGAKKLGDIACSVGFVRSRGTCSIHGYISLHLRCFSSTIVFLACVLLFFCLSCSQKKAVTLEKRLALAQKELTILSPTKDVEDIPMELVESDLLGQDFEWTKTFFATLQISLRKRQICELEKQLDIHRRAKYFDASKFSESETARFQKWFKQNTLAGKRLFFSDEYCSFAQQMLRILLAGQVNPNVVVEVQGLPKRAVNPPQKDASPPQVVSEPLLRCVSSNRLSHSLRENRQYDELVRVLLKLGANPDVCLSPKEEFLSSRGCSVVLTEGGIDEMKGYLLPLLSKIPFTSEALVERLIYLKHNLVEKDKQANTALHYAAKIGSAKLVALMMLEGMDVNARNNEGETPLHLALKYGHLHLEPLLLLGGAAPTLKNKEGKLPEDYREISLFFQNIEKKDYKAVRAALEKGMNPNMLYGNGYSILQMACKNNDVELVRLLLEFNADVEVSGEYYKPLVLAFDNNLEIFKLLIEKGADPNAEIVGQTNSILGELCSGSIFKKRDKDEEFEYLSALLNTKKPLSLYAKNGKPIQLFANKKSVKFVSLLLEHYETLPAGTPFLVQALRYDYPDSIIEKLLELKADVNVVDSFFDNQYRKVTPLFLAVEKDRIKTVELLLKHGADINWKDKDGKTVRDLSCSDEIRQLLK